MDHTTLIAQVREGDPAAFTELVERYQNLAFGYAMVILRDVQLAQDVTQQAFIAVHSSLPSLEDPETFPAWLRSIVRHHCARILRVRRLRSVSLEAAPHLAAAIPGPEQCVEHNDSLDAILKAVGALPRLQREVTALYYFNDYSQQEVAAFLGIPVTTVNNRLHAARKQLRAILPPPSTIGQTLKPHLLRSEFSERIGHIVRQEGPLVDIHMTGESVPAIFDTLVASAQATDIPCPLRVAQHIGNGVTRCVRISPETDRTSNGLNMRSDAPLTQSVTPATVHAILSVLDHLGPETKESGEQRHVLETGIKVIDLLCPLPEQGRIGVFGDIGVGKMVLIQEWVQRLSGRGHLTVFAFVNGHDEVPFLRHLADRDQPVFPSSPSVQVVYIPVEHPDTLFTRMAPHCFDATLFLSKRVADSGIYPAIDPLVSTSRLLRPGIVGDEHYDTAVAVRRLLRRHRQLQAPDRADDVAAPAEHRAAMARARRIERFFSQPLFVAEPWTRQPGQWVSRGDTVQSFHNLLAGAYDALPECAFDFQGALDHARAISTPR